MTKRLIIVLLLLGLVFGGIFGFKAFVNTKMTEFFDNMEPPPATVTTAEAQTSQWQPTLAAVGTLVAANGIDVTPEVPGVVKQIAFESGARVQAGDVLVQLDTATDQAQLDVLRAQRDLAKAELDRQRALLKRRTTSQAEFDAAESNYRQVLASIANQQAVIAKKTIKAPFAGEVGIRKVDLGSFVNTGTAVVSLQQIDPLRLRFSLPEQQLPQVAVGQTVHTRVDAFADRRFTGTITAIEPAVTAATRTVQVEARVDNRERLLRPGMFARVEVVLPGTNDYLTLPNSAITYNPYGDSVFLVEPAASDAEGAKPTVRRAFVKLGPARGDQVAVLSGLETGQQVVTSGQLKLRNGSRIVIDNSRTPADAAQPQVENK